MPMPLFSFLRTHTKLRRTLFFFAALYVGCLAYIVIAQRSFLYRPPSAPYVMPGHWPTAFTGIFESGVSMQDGAHYGWHIRPSTRKATILFMHGNADSLNTIEERLHPFMAAGYGVYIVEYPGYGDNPGTPSEKSIYDSMEKFIDLLHTLKVPDNRIILMGHSLGAAVAVEMATRYKMGAVVLMAPFLSTAEMASRRYPFFPLSPFVLDKFDNESKINKISSPLLIFAGDQDKVVPPADSEKLYNLAQDPKGIHILKGYGHSNIFTSEFYKTTMDWLETLPVNEGDLHATTPGANETWVIKDEPQQQDYVPVPEMPQPVQGGAQNSVAPANPSDHGQGDQPAAPNGPQ